MSEIFLGRYLRGRYKQHETISDIGGKLIMEGDGYPFIQKPYSTKPFGKLEGLKKTWA